MHFPKVTVSIPTYNQIEFIGTAIDSALLQDYPNLEVIVSDDSTNDETGELAKTYTHDPRFRYFRNIPSLGRVKNYRTQLYDRASGEWFVNLDGDDHFTDKTFISGAIESIYRAGRNDTLFYMASKTMEYPNSNRILQPRLPAAETVMKAGDYFTNYYSIAYFGHLTTVYNSARAKESGFFEKDIISSDLFSFLKWCLSHNDKQIILSKKNVGKWVQHGENESSNYTFRKYFKNTGMYFSLFSFALKKHKVSLFDNIKFLVLSLFLSWGSYFKNILMPKK